MARLQTLRPQNKERRLCRLPKAAGARGPNADYNITDEALTIDKVKFDQEAAATNRGNEEAFGFRSVKPVYKHHGSTFTSSTGFLPEHNRLTEPARYYADEAGIQLPAEWNKIVTLQLQLVQAKIAGDETAAVELFKECNRLRVNITPFVSKDGVLFMLSGAFDNIHNLKFDYIIRNYLTMDIATLPEEAAHFGDAVDKRIWTKYGHLLRGRTMFMLPRPIPPVRNKCKINAEI